MKSLDAHSAWRGNVGVFTSAQLTQQGGLAAYVRSLSQTLESRGTTIQWNGDLPECSKDVSELWQAKVQQLLPLMSRRRLRWVARCVAERHCAPWCSDAIHNIDVVHYVGTGWNLFGFAVERAARRVGAIVSCWPAVHPGSWGDSPLDVDLYRRMDAVFVQSDFEREHLAKLGVPVEKMVRCGCAPSVAADGDGARFRERYQVENCELVLFVGRRHRSKGYHDLRNAIQRMRAGGRNVVLASIGADVESPYPALSAEAELDLGLADDATKADAYAACDVFALPSDAESFGIVFVEAWMYEKPVICGPAPASMELIRRHAGGLVSDGTAADVERALTILLNDHSLRQRLGRAGKTAVDEDYSMESVARTHVATWNRCLAGASSKKLTFLGPAANSL